MACALAGALLAACPAHAQTRPSPFDEFRARLSELGNGLRTARGQFSRKKSSATRFEEVKDKLVVIVCGEKAGSGFIVRDGGRPYLFTNAHVVQRGAVIAHRLDGTRLMLGPRDEAVGRDMVVLGNSDGRGVVTEIRGKVIGVGPREIEVDAAFVIGNSGSPVLDRHGRVIGIATYLRDCRDDADWSKANTRFNGIRRFALRLLGTRWARK